MTNTITATSQATRLAIGSILIGCCVLALKFLAYWLTGSLALFSDALESIVNVVAAGAALAAIRYGGKPADADHPYGHAKAEYFAAVLEGVLIIVAALAIIVTALTLLTNPKIITLNWPGLAVAGLAGVINFVWSRHLLLRARALRSPALEADAHHLMSDVVSTIGTTLGVLLAMGSGIAILDPVLALLVAGNILWSGTKLIRASVDGLMDMAPDAVMQGDLQAIIRRTSKGALEAHDFRSRLAGFNLFIDFHLVVPGSMSVHEAHDICDRIEQGIKAEFPNAATTIHVEPDHKAKRKGLVF